MAATGKYFLLIYASSCTLQGLHDQLLRLFSYHCILDCFPSSY